MPDLSLLQKPILISFNELFLKAVEDILEPITPNHNLKAMLKNDIP